MSDSNQNRRRGNQGPPGPKGDDGKNGMDGKDGTNGSNGSNGANGADGRPGDLPIYQVITPENNTSPINLNLCADLIALDTSDFSPLFRLGGFGVPKYVRIKLLYTNGLPAIIETCSGGIVELSPTLPFILLFWDGCSWHILDNPGDINAFYPSNSCPRRLFPSDHTGGSGLGTGGQALALSANGCTLAVGGPYDNDGTGAAFVFINIFGEWREQVKLVGTGATGSANQGTSVALSASGNTLAVGGNTDNGGVGAVWIWTRVNCVWTQQAGPLIGSGATGSSAQGTSVALSADGNTLAVGGPGDNSNFGAVWVWTRDGVGNWNQQGSLLIGTGLLSLTSREGTSVSLSADGNTLAAGAPGDNSLVGSVIIWTRFDEVWSQQTLTPLIGSGAIAPVQQGAKVSLSADGNTLAEGGSEYKSCGGAVWIFVRSTGVWTQQAGPLTPVQPASDPVVPGEKQYVVVLSADGNTLAVGAPNDKTNIGAVWIYRRLDNSWSQFGLRIVADPTCSSHQGSSVALSSDASVFAMAAPTTSCDVGFVYVYGGGCWSPP
jgi:hypothetical protein